MEFYDNTRVSGHKACERRYYYRHVRNWDTEGEPYKANFGTCWHSAMDAIWPHMCKPRTGPLKEDFRRDMQQLGYLAFMEKWREKDMPESSRSSLDLRKQGAIKTKSIQYCIFAALSRISRFNWLTCSSVMTPSSERMSRESKLSVVRESISVIPQTTESF